MYLTIDTSALIAVIGNGTSKDKIIEITASYSPCIPASVHWEIGHAFSALLKRQRTDLKLAKLALKAYQKFL